MMLKNIAAVLVVLFLIVSCASTPTTPEGFDKAKAEAYEAQRKALEINADKEVPSIFEKAESVLSMAEEKEAGSELDEAMSGYIDAKVKFNLAITETNKKRTVDTYVEETNPLLEKIDQQIKELE